MRRVKWEEPDRDGNAIACTATIEEAIETAVKTAAKHDYVYMSDEEALEDFLTVHWAWIEETP